MEGKAKEMSDSSADSEEDSSEPTGEESNSQSKVNSFFFILKSSC